MATLAEALLALSDLHARGLLTDDEFSRAKARVIAGWPSPPTGPAASASAPAAPRPAPTRPLNPVVPGVGLSLAAAPITGGGMAG